LIEYKIYSEIIAGDAVSTRYTIISGGEGSFQIDTWAGNRRLICTPEVPSYIRTALCAWCDNFIDMPIYDYLNKLFT
jgi:hypothetical protein